MDDEKWKDLRDYLLSFDTFAQSPQEGINYIEGSLRRFQITLDMVPPGGSGQRLLEMGSGPYFFTLLLKKYRPQYQLDLANFYGDQHSSTGEHFVRSAKYQEEHHFPYQNFNCEYDPFPYTDECFDVVLCCEIIEHLTVDPTHMLYEIHRILKPQGLLLLTTPNVHNLLYGLRLLRGKGNIFHPYSGYGVYGRHQREYTLEELIDLLEGVGYQIIQSRIDDIYVYRLHLALLKRLWCRWRDNLFVLARKRGERQQYYPASLYTARTKDKGRTPAEPVTCVARQSRATRERNEFSGVSRCGSDGLGTWDE